MHSSAPRRGGGVSRHMWSYTNTPSRPASSARRATVIGISVFFALAHRDPRTFLPDLLGGLAMVYTRAVSGSLWPALLMHAAFNTTSAILALVAGPEADVFTRWQTAAATLACIVLLALFGRLAGRSAACAAGREADTQ